VSLDYEKTKYGKRQAFMDKYGFEGGHTSWAHGYEISTFIQPEDNCAIVYLSMRPIQKVGIDEREYLLNTNGEWDRFSGAIEDKHRIALPGKFPVFKYP